MNIRSALYTVARLMGDANAVKRGTVGKRIARRAAGRVTGRLLGGLFRMNVHWADDGTPGPPVNARPDLGDTWSGGYWDDELGEWVRYAPDVIAEIAAQWEAAGFTAADVAAWTSAGARSAAEAAPLRDRGMVPNPDAPGRFPGGVGVTIHYPPPDVPPSRSTSRGCPPGDVSPADPPASSP